MYIIFEGMVGTGKSTQSKKLYNYLKQKYPRKEIVWTKEPGGTEISQKIRECVQGTEYNEEMQPICEVYLYAASRAQALRVVVKPTLQRGGIVVSDRSFITALANQAYGWGLGIKKVMEINNPAIDGVLPDLVVFLEMDPRIAISRVSDHDGDRFERLGIDFYKKIQSGYKKISKMKMFKNKWITVRVTTDPVEENFKNILKALKSYLP